MNPKVEVLPITEGATKKLSKKHNAFVDEYFRLFNATEAYISVYDNASYDSARAASARLMADPRIKEECERRIERSRQETQKFLLLHGIHKTREKASFIYLIGASNGLVKIGKTTDTGSRIAILNTGSPVELTIIACFKTTLADEVEERLHSVYAEKRIKGEWFALTPEDIETIKNEFNPQA